MLPLGDPNVQSGGVKPDLTPVGTWRGKSEVDSGKDPTVAELGKIESIRKITNRQLYIFRDPYFEFPECRCAVKNQVSGERPFFEFKLLFAHHIETTYADGFG